MRQPASAPLEDAQSSTPMVHGEQVTISNDEGRRLFSPLTFSIPEASVTILSSSTPVSRYALACAITGRLPQPRFHLVGELAVDGKTSPPLIRAVTALPQSWHVRGAATSLDRRIAAVQWAMKRHPALIALSPGLDGLSPPEAATLLTFARDNCPGVSVVVTGKADDSSPEVTALCDTRIHLDD